jgi:lipooligosaccharide transport system permease protein
MQTGTLGVGQPVMFSADSRGSYRSAAATPLRPTDIFAGHLLFIAFRLAVNAIAFSVVIAAFGIFSPGMAALLVLPAVLTGLAIAAPMAAWAVTLRRPSVLAGFMRFVILPVYLLSGTFFAATRLPIWIRPVIYVSPLWHGVDLCRMIALNSGTAAELWLHLAYLSAFAIIGIAVACRTYRRRLHV